MDLQHEVPMALRAAYLALHRRTEAELVELGVTADQFVLLAALAEGHAMTQRELARRMASDPSTVRAMLVLLERQGLVRREPHPTDSRARMVALTAVGKRQFRQLWKASSPIRGAIIDRLGPVDAATLIQLLTRVASVLQPADALAGVATETSRKSVSPPE